VERSVLELQTRIRPGNSGGPFVLADGRVAGVVFAASSADDEVGYAIAASELPPLLDDAVGATEPVGTGPCVG
jgi:S1-C subfamily serine protease